jgi:hypothetical protein
MRHGCHIVTLGAAILLAALSGVAQAGGTISVCISGNGTGTISVGGRAASDGQQLSYPYSKQVRIVAVPDGGSYFKGWWANGNSTVEEAGLTTTDLNLDGHTTLFVVFSKKNTATYKLTIITVGNGQVFDGQKQATAAETYLFNDPTTVELQAVLGTGATFKGWTGSAVTNHRVNDPTDKGRPGDPNGAVITVLVDGSYDLCATFAGGTPGVPSPAKNWNLCVQTLPAAPVQWYELGAPQGKGKDIVATLWGKVLKDDAFNDPSGCSWRFKYKKRSDANWTINSWGSPKKFKGQEFSEPVPYLAPGTTYVFAAQIMNCRGTSEWSAEQTFVTPAPLQQTLHVDDDASCDPGPHDMSVSDPAEDGSAEHPFDSLQKAVNAIKDISTTVIVHEGVYTESVDFKGKKVTVLAQWLVDSKVAGASIVQGLDGAPGVSCTAGEKADCLLQGLTIMGGANAPAVWCNGGSPRLAHCLVVGTGYTGVLCQNSAASLVNCTIAGNLGPGLDSQDSHIVMTNCIVWDNTPVGIATTSGTAPSVTYSDVQGGIAGSGNVDVNATTSGTAPSVTYSDVQGGIAGSGNMDVNPSFADPGYWNDPNAGDFYVPGDYHLRSTTGRFWPVFKMWVSDKVDSPCIDAGDPATDATAEPKPNGGLVNMGAYGGTSQASKSK